MSSKKSIQLTTLHKDFKRLQNVYGSPFHSPIYGAGCTLRPTCMFIFMNPTAKNISAKKSWKGLRAPWLGTKNVWNVLYASGCMSKKYFDYTQSLQPQEWTPDFSQKLYTHIQAKKCFVTNLAKCTQQDARALHTTTFHAYMNLIKKEIELLRPKYIFTFGNQVSSILLGKPISVSTYIKNKKEILMIGKNTYDVYPTYYPVGQGRRNMPRAIKRIQAVLSN